MVDGGVSRADLKPAEFEHTLRSKAPTAPVLDALPRLSSLGVELPGEGDQADARLCEAAG